MVRMYIGKSRHHFLKGSLVVDHLVGGRERIVNPLLIQKPLEFLSDYIAQ